MEYLRYPVAGFVKFMQDKTGISRTLINALKDTGCFPGEVISLDQMQQDVRVKRYISELDKSKAGNWNRDRAQFCYFGENYPTFELDALAGAVLMWNTQTFAKDIGMLLQTGYRNEYISPGNGPKICQLLGMEKSGAIGIDCGCASMAAMAGVAHSMILSGISKKSILCLARTQCGTYGRSRWHEDHTQVVLGDMCGGFLISGARPQTFKSFAAKVGMSGFNAVAVTSSEQKHVRVIDLQVARDVVPKMYPLAKATLEEALVGAGIEKVDLKTIFCHQPFACAAEMPSAFGATQAQCDGTTFRRYGNLLHCSPLASLYHSIARNKTCKGDLFAVAPFAAGIASCAFVERASEELIDSVLHVVREDGLWDLETTQVGKFKDSF